MVLFFPMTRSIRCVALFLWILFHSYCMFGVPEPGLYDADDWACRPGQYSTDSFPNRARNVHNRYRQQHVRCRRYNNASVRLISIPQCTVYYSLLYSRVQYCRCCFLAGPPDSLPIPTVSQALTRSQLPGVPGHSRASDWLGDCSCLCLLRHVDPVNGAH